MSARPQFKSRAEAMAWHAAQPQRAQTQLPQQQQQQQQQPKQQQQPQQHPQQRPQPQQRNAPPPSAAGVGRSLEADVSFIAGASACYCAITTCRVPVYRQIPTCEAVNWPAPAAWIEQNSTLLVHGPQQYTSDKKNIWTFVRHVCPDSGAVTSLAIPLVLGDAACQQVAGQASDQQTLTNFHIPCTTSFDLTPAH